MADPVKPTRLRPTPALLVKMLLAALLLGACAPVSTPQPTGAATSAPTDTPPPPTAATSAAHTSATAPDASATAAPATETAPASLPPTGTPTPAALNPLTGLAVDDPAVLERRPLAIKVAHFPRHVRAAQVGLSLADNVWEHYAEGGTVRFTAIFLSQAPERIGNVRSARLIDIHLGYAYSAMVIASGSSTGTLNRFREAGLYDRLIAEATGYRGCPILCREASASVTTDKLFTNAPALWDLATNLGLNGPQDLSGFTFDEAVPARGEAAATVHIDFQLNNTITEWRYNAGTQRYERWVDSVETAAGAPNLAPHVDTLTGEALTAANVVVLYAPYIPSNIWEEDGGTRHYSYDVVLTGSGPARLFRDGQMYTLTWERAETSSGLPRLLDASGQPVAFRPGNTWFEVLDPDSPTTFAAGVFQARSKVPDASALPTATP
jgi:hypothetical protein